MFSQVCFKCFNSRLCEIKSLLFLFFSREEAVAEPRVGNLVPLLSFLCRIMSNEIAFHSLFSQLFHGTLVSLSKVILLCHLNF